MSATPDSTPSPGSPAVPPAAPPAPEAAARRCENCGATLFGDHCFACGQPTKGLVRHFSSIMGDFVDTVFNIDSRVLRTLGPLLARPGFLSLEYFAGRRVRYVTPMRLFLFLSLLAFFVAHLTIEYEDEVPDQGTKSGLRVGAAQEDSFEAADTVAQVQKVRTQALAELAKARKSVEGVPAGTVGVDIAIREVEEKSARRIARIRELERAKAAGRPAPPVLPDSRDRDDMNFRFNGEKWDPVSNPLRFDWLPDAVNASLNRRIGHAREVLRQSKSPKPVVDAMFNVLPQTLLVMMPLFALMLKVAYFFRRRLYMEHLIVALHSHSFIALAVILIMGESWLLALAPGGGFWESALNWLRGLTIAWIPLYLLLMQKRVYGQGWLMTLAKFGVLGMCYSILVSFAMGAAILVGLLTL